MAAHVLGCCVIAVRSGYTARQLAHALGAGVDAVLVDPSTLSPELMQAAGSARVLSLGDCLGATDLLDYAGEGGASTAMGCADDIASVSFTSGSTGQPKGCMLTYRTLSTYWSWRPPRDWSPVLRELADAFERYLLFGTLASSVVLDFLALCLLGNGTAVIPEPDARLLFPYAVERYRITGAITTVPRLYQMMDVLQDESVDVSSLRALMVSGSRINASRFASAVDRLGPVIYQGYGLSEAGLVSMLRPSDIARHSSSALTSVGRALAGVEISVRDEQDRPLASGGTGEIWVRSPYQMGGYWEQPEETRETLRDGWLRTRDLGCVDDDGLLHLVGRTRDVIIVSPPADETASGRLWKATVYAGPIERVLASHPDVEQAYVAGVQDPQIGEAVLAFVVPGAGRTLDHAALAELVRAELGEESVPKRVTEIPRVLVDAAGRPDKRALLELYGPRPGAEVPCG